MLSFTIISLVLLVYCIHYISAKEIEEEEDEIGYIQSVLSNSDDPIVSIKSKYQHIEIYNSDHFGKIFVLDEALQLTEKDAPHYNEMLAHVPIMEYLKTHDVKDSKDTILKVLVVGGGDGYVVNELVKYSKIGVINHVELDEEVINVSKKYLPRGEAWKDSRVNLIIEDGVNFVIEQAESGHTYDVVIQDSSDPQWEEEDGSITTLPSSVLYEKSHFDNIYKLLEPKNGVFMMQAETYNIPSNLLSIKKWRKLLLDVGFATVRYGTIAIPTYPTGQIGFFVAHISTTDIRSATTIIQYVMKNL